MEIKHLSLEWKTDHEGIIEGYGSVFDVVDQGGDIIAPGAFKQSLNSARKVRMLFQHDPNAVVGVWNTIEEDSKGLRVSGRILTKVRAGAEAYEMIKAGAIDGLSIGYRTIKSMDRNGKRVIMQAELWEVSLVTFPMNEAASIDTVKSAHESTSEAAKWLARAIKLHEGHMNGTVDTTEASQAEMMQMMMKAYALLTGSEESASMKMPGMEDHKSYVPSMRELERTLTQDAGLSRSLTRQLMAGGYNAIKSMQDAGRIAEDVADLLRQRAAM